MALSLDATKKINTSKFSTNKHKYIQDKTTYSMTKEQTRSAYGHNTSAKFARIDPNKKFGHL